MPASYLKIGGELMQDAILLLVEVEQKLNQHWWCRVECRQTLDRRFPIESALGKDLQILTYDQQGAENVIFDGFVLDGELEYEIYGNFLVRITGVTRSYKLDLTPQEAYFRKKTLQDVANTLTGQDGLSADVKVPAKPSKNYVQWGETDFSFLHRLADDYHAWIRPIPQGIQICNSFQPGTKVEWRAEDGLLSFEVTGRMAAPAFSGTHYSARSMQSTDFQAVAKAATFTGASGRMVGAVQRASADLPAGYIHLDLRAATADEYNELLERESVRSIGAGVFARGQSLNQAIRAGCTLEVSGTMDAQGTYGVTEVLHRWTQRGYHNEFRCTPWTNFISPERPEPKPMRGLVTARVVDQNDPRKMGRVKVQYDWQEDGETGWIRMTSPHAGADRGFMFMPEKGDEVLVAFEHGDPERPYVVGTLWNGVDKAPRTEFWGEDIASNDVKRIVTKSGHRIQLSDKEGKEAIVIATPSKLKIALLEKADETGRSMILLHSEDGDIFVSAPNGRVHIKSKYFSREVGAAAGVSGQPMPAPKPQPKSSLAAPKDSSSALRTPVTVAASGVARSAVSSAGKDAAPCGEDRKPSGLVHSREMAKPVTELPPTCTTERMKANLNSCDGGTGQWSAAKKAIGKEPVVQVAPTASDFEAETDTSSGTITIAPTTDCCSATSSLFFELNNVRNTSEFDKMDTKAGKGELGREDYTKLQEKIEYEGVIRLRDSFAKCKKSWGCGSGATSGYESVSDDFDTYYNTQLEKRHKDHYRKDWDKLYEAEYEAKQKKASQ